MSGKYSGLLQDQEHRLALRRGALERAIKEMYNILPCRHPRLANTQLYSQLLAGRHPSSAILLPHKPHSGVRYQESSLGQDLIGYIRESLIYKGFNFFKQGKIPFLRMTLRQTEVEIRQSRFRYKRTPLYYRCHRCLYIKQYTDPLYIFHSVQTPIRKNNFIPIKPLNDPFIKYQTTFCDFSVFYFFLF